MVASHYRAEIFLGGADLSKNSAFYTDTLAPQTIVFPIRTGKSTSNPGKLVRGALSASSYGLVSFTETPLDFETTEVFRAFVAIEKQHRQMR